MKTYYECIPCFIKQALDALKEVESDDDATQKALRKVLKEASSFDLRLSPPEMGQIIHRIIREETEQVDPYREIKKRSIEMAKKLEPLVWDTIQKSNDTFETAVRFAIAGNIMDFALASTWDENKINNSFYQVGNNCIDQDIIKELKIAIQKAKTVLYLGDNAGETVFDRLLIRCFPGEAQVTYVVKAGPIINDAVYEDAIESGLNECAELIDNGSDAPGTVLSQCSEEFKKRYENADVIIAKGQANFETLNTASRDMYFLTQIKCPVIAHHYLYRVGDWVVASQSQLKSKRKGDSNDDNKG